MVAVFYRGVVETFGDLVGDLVHRLADFASDHHLHHHVQLDVEHQPHAGVRIVHGVELQPEKEGERRTFVAGHLDQFVLFPLHDPQPGRETLHLERATVGVGLPLFHLVLQDRGEVGEVGERAVDDGGGTQYPHLVAFVFFHESVLSGFDANSVPDFLSGNVPFQGRFYCLQVEGDSRHSRRASSSSGWT